MKSKILVSITGNKDWHYFDKIRELRERKIDQFALFLECFNLKQRKEIYEHLKKMKIKEIPLVHIRDDMDKYELEFLFKNYKSRYFTIHEDHFNVISRWEGFEKNLFLEMNTDNFVSEKVRVENIGGFCVDLAHYQKQKDRKTIDYDYIYKRKEKSEFFQCNHLSGYCSKKMTDLHWVEKEKDFDYLKKLPKFIFGKWLAIEINNSIEEQLKFKKYILKMINFNK